MKQQYEEEFLKYRPMWQYRLCWAIAILCALAAISSFQSCKTSKDVEGRRKAAMAKFDKLKNMCDKDTALAIVPPQFAHKYWPVRIKYLPGVPKSKSSTPEVKKGKETGGTINIDSAYQAGVKSVYFTCPPCDTFYFHDTTETVDTFLQVDSAAIKVLQLELIDAQKATVRAESKTAEAEVKLKNQVQKNDDLEAKFKTCRSKLYWTWGIIAAILLAIIGYKWFRSTPLGKVVLP